MRGCRRERQAKGNEHLIDARERSCCVAWGARRTLSQRPWGSNRWTEQVLIDAIGCVEGQRERGEREERELERVLFVAVMYIEGYCAILRVHFIKLPIRNHTAVHHSGLYQEEDCKDE